MSESKIEMMNYSTNTAEHLTSPISIHDESIHSINNTELLSGMQYPYDECQSYINNITHSPLINRRGSFQHSSSTNAMDLLAHQTILPNIHQYPINQDLNPEHIHRPTNEHITYRQDVAIRYLQPPTPPPPGPVVIREIRAPAPPEAPPLVIRQRPNAPLTPPPVVIREHPPLPPPIVPPHTVNKVLPPPPPLPRKVIIERQAPLPQKPQSVIIEKWLPYRPPPDRRVVVERAPPIMPRPIQKNTIITYDAPHVDLVKNVHHLGVVRADPHLYMVQYGSHLASNEYVRHTMEKFCLGNNYMQMIQMQTTPHLPLMNSNHLQTNYAHINRQQSMTVGGQNTSNIYHVQDEDLGETILPNQLHSSLDGLNNTEILQ
ncbi:unnamed protein product [Rotaria sordida]|uniref:Uncharacterized protein n=2 Tax=Rotaria sordida TaxID=392033 RepID=A0A814VI10_9BILA|nr:unnamed protein product [Rotaria sordida]